MRKTPARLLFACLTLTGTAGAQETRFEVAPEFQMRTLLTAEQIGPTWDRMASDNTGRVYVSILNEGLLRITAPSNLTNSDPSEFRIESVGTRVASIRGMAWGRGTLYLIGEGPAGTGVYRFNDRNSNDLFEAGEEEMVVKFKGDPRDGPRDLAFGPDGLLYLLNGTAQPDASRPSASSPYRDTLEATILAALPDPAGLNSGVKAPGPHLLRHDFESREMEMVAGGLGSVRNLAFMENGDLLTVEGENARDRGLPWHRPARLLHLVPGGEYGWRSGSGVWPDRWTDQNPPVAELGLLIPSGLAACTHNGMSQRYRGALFIADSAHPRLLAATFRAEGSSLALSNLDTLVRASPGEQLTFGDLELGPGGSLLATAIGADGKSRLLALSFLGDKKEDSTFKEPEHALRGMRREMDKLAAKPQARWVDSIWLNLDRGSCQHVTQSVRRALENAPQDTWKSRALTEKDRNKALSALLALARSERDRLSRHDLFAALWEHLPGCDDAPSRTIALRILTCARERLGEPRPETYPKFQKLLTSWLTPDLVDEPGLLIDTASTLVSLKSPDVVAACAPLLCSNRLTFTEKTALATSLLSHPAPLSLESAKPLISFLSQAQQPGKLPLKLNEWFSEARETPAPGVNLASHFEALRQALWQKLPRDPAGLSDTEATALAKRLTEASQALAALPKSGESWTPADSPTLATVPDKFEPSSERGKQVFTAARCAVCHGAGAPGPDLAGISERQGREEVVKAILSPSSSVLAKHRLTSLNLADGTTVLGKVLLETPEKVVLQPSLQNAAPLVFKPSEIKARGTAAISPMPENLLLGFSHKKIADLLAYLGFKNAPAE